MAEGVVVNVTAALTGPARPASRASAAKNLRAVVFIRLLLEWPHIDIKGELSLLNWIHLHYERCKSFVKSLLRELLREDYCESPQTPWQGRGAHFFRSTAS